MYYLYLIKNNTNNVAYVGIAKERVTDKTPCEGRFKEHKREGRKGSNGKRGMYKRMQAGDDFSFTVVKPLLKAKTLHQAKYEEAQYIKMLKGLGLKLYNVEEDSTKRGCYWQK